MLSGDVKAKLRGSKVVRYKGRVQLFSKACCFIANTKFFQTDLNFVTKIKRQIYENIFNVLSQASSTTEPAFKHNGKTRGWSKEACQRQSSGRAHGLLGTFIFPKSATPQLFLVLVLSVFGLICSVM